MRLGKNASRRADDELKKLMTGSSALVLALLILLAVLLSGFLGRSGLEAAEALSAGDPLGLALERAPKVTAAPAGSPSATAGLTVEVAEVEPDVEPEVAARLLRITAEVLDRRISLGGEGPKILIYHTHDTEAYTQTEQYEYVPSGDWRTRDTSRSVIAVGEELARILNEEYGIETIHDTTAHEPPLITTAYSRSLATMLRYKREYPSLEMFIDLHRDGVGAEGYESDYVTVNGAQAARLMFVVGTGQGAAGTEDDPKPDFESNYALAAALTQRLNAFDPRFTRKVRVKTGKYNQFVSNKCLLVEVGHNANTLEQALAAMPYLAAAIADTAGIRPAGGTIDFAP